MNFYFSGKLSLGEKLPCCQCARANDTILRNHLNGLPTLKCLVTKLCHVFFVMCPRLGATERKFQDNLQGIV